MITNNITFSPLICETCAHKHVCNHNACYGMPYAKYYVNEENYFEFPFGVGDTVFFVNNRTKGGNYVVTETKIVKIGKRKSGAYFQMDINSMYETSISAVGKTVFLTAKEAEDAARKENERNPYNQVCFQLQEVT